VAKYTGEVVTDKEAERRGRLYDFIGRTYLFDIDGLLDDDEEDEDDMFGLDNISFVQKSKGAAVDRLTIDAFHYGNISRFFNHSCDPTLTVYACFIENQDPRCHEVSDHVLFAI
jgi:histone-lysine N-methyltransferase SUV39H